MSKRITLKAVMELNDDVFDVLEDVLIDMDKNHKLYKKVSLMYDRVLDLNNKYYKVDIHVGCHNYPNCDEFGCGD